MSLVWTSLKGPQLKWRLPTGVKIRAMFSSPLGGPTAAVYSSVFEIIPFPLDLTSSGFTALRAVLFFFLKTEEHGSGSEGPNLTVCADDHLAAGPGGGIMKDGS